MAQNFDPFHVPQQNRRNKLRVNTSQTQPQQILMMNNNNSSPPDPLQQGLSLSLSFQLLDDSQRYNNAVTVLGDFLKHNNGVISSVPLGPFTGYASILKNSRFLKPAQQVLDDLYGSVNSDLLDVLTECDVIRESFAFSDRVKLQFKDSKLMFLLDEVYKKYKLYCQQMQTVVASFETVAGLGNAAPYICYAIKTVSKNFSCLKNALLNQIHFPLNDEQVKKNPRFFAAADETCENQTQGFSFLQHPVWRSQRGLPDHAVALLKTWLFEHFLHPYPSDSEKQILAQHTGLSRTQVSNWFINARVRLWKPMVEEVYKLSSQQPHQVPLEAVMNHNTNIINPCDFYQHNNKPDNIKTKRSRHELIDDMSGQRQRQEDTNLVSFENYQEGGISGRNEVSLALGLHQNNYGGINIAQHVNNLQLFGLMDSASASASAAASFQSQSHNFGNIE